MQEQLTLQEFAAEKGITADAVKKMIQRKSLPEGFSVIELSARKRMIVREKSIAAEGTELKYIHPDDLTPEQIIKLDEAYEIYQGNVSKISKHCTIHYTTVYRFIKKQYKKKDERRADAGTCKKLSPAQLQIARKSFDSWFAANAQKKCIAGYIPGT
jgi:hypothetical protein